MAVDFSELEVTQRMRRDEVTVHKKSRKRTRLISSNLENTSMVKRVYILLA